MISEFFKKTRFWHTLVYVTVDQWSNTMPFSFNTLPNVLENLSEEIHVAFGTYGLSPSFDTEITLCTIK